MLTLSPRQTQILKAVVEEYITTAEPVASEQLEKKYNLGVSPATIRNEMSDLTDMGLLKQPHTSAGRIPTSMGLRFYVDHLMQEKRLSVADEVSAKESVWDARFDFEKLMRQATLALAEKTRTMSLIATSDGHIYYSGVANILDMPEFWEIDVARTVLATLDQHQRFRQLFFEREYNQNPVHIVFGADLGWPYFDPVGLAFTYFSAGSNRQGSIAVIGPSRLNFPYVIPTLRYFSDLLTELNSKW